MPKPRTITVPVTPPAGQAGDEAFIEGDDSAFLLRLTKSSGSDHLEAVRDLGGMAEHDRGRAVLFRR